MGVGTRKVPGPPRPRRCARIWIGVGTHDLFHDEDLDHARRLEAAGVPCRVDLVPGAVHGFDVVAPKSQVSQRFFAKAQKCGVLRAALTQVG